MSTMQNFDYSRYIINDGVVLENLNLKNCKITGITNRDLEIRNCIFEKVVFENHFSKGYRCVAFEECNFSKCRFYDTFEEKIIELIVINNVFEECIFENIKYCVCTGQSEVCESKFTNCTFKNILIDGQICFIGLEMCGGGMTYLDLHCESIMGNQFTDMKMEKININRGFIKNRMKNIVFDEVVLHTSDYEKMYGESVYIECDTNGLTVIHHS